MSEHIVFQIQVGREIEDAEYEALQQIVEQIIDKELPLDAIGLFVFSLTRLKRQEKENE